VAHVVPFAPNCTNELGHISIHMVNKTRDDGQMAMMAYG